MRLDTPITGSGAPSPADASSRWPPFHVGRARALKGGATNTPRGCTLTVLLLCTFLEVGRPNCLRTQVSMMCRSLAQCPLRNDLQTDTEDLHAIYADGSTISYCPTSGLPSGGKKTGLALALQLAGLCPCALRRGKVYALLHQKMHERALALFALRSIHPGHG